MSEPKQQDKPFQISKWKVWEAFERVKANKGAAGVDEQSIAEFEADRDPNLYKIWNRMSSGSYFPPPVKAVEIPGAGGNGVRVLGVPTAADRIAQTVARLYLEPEVEPIFHPDSYGYRPGKSALDAVAACRQRCWRADWVIDLDIQAFFDTVPWDLVLKAVARHISPGQAWILLYVGRWLKAPLQKQDGTLVTRDRGTPQGSAISPLIANLFMHYAFGAWLVREFPGVRFERYCDDAVVHCASEQQARQGRDAIAGRRAQAGLELHLEKTRIVYCKDDDRRGDHEATSFVFLGYEFRPRLAKNRYGKHLVSFLPAVSKEAMKAMGAEIRSWHWAKRSDKSLGDLALMFNSKVQGWINYYGRFYRSRLLYFLRRLNDHLVRWACRKYDKRLRNRERRAMELLAGAARRSPWLHPDKTKVVDLRQGREGLDFPGCHFRARMSGRLWEQQRIVRCYLHRWPSARAMKRLREKIRHRTGRNRAGADICEVIADLNPLLRGWGNYFRTGNAAAKFRQADDYVVRRLRSLMVKKRGRNLHAGQAQAWTEEWFNGHGLYRLRGTIRYPKTA